MDKHARYRPGKQKKCGCGSGKHFKNCHGLVQLAKPNRPPQLKISPIPKPAKPPIQPSITSGKPWGMSGEEIQLTVVPVYEQSTLLPEPDLSGKPGRYKVQLLLGKPGQRSTSEMEKKFIDNEIGDSHIAITKPINERDSKRDAAAYIFHANSIEFTGRPNDSGRLGKLTAELGAANMQNAETIAYNAINPFLSSLALHLDIPVHVETVQVTELSTSMSALRVHAPNFNMTFSVGVAPPLKREFCHYASLYREAMNTNSNFYRFLCLFKIIESVTHRRSRLAQESKDAGNDVSKRVREEVPKDNSELRELLKIVYPWRTFWDDSTLGQILPQEARGKKLKTVRDNQLEPIRIGIAHALLKSGEIRITIDNLEHVQMVNRWLPFCRVFARLMLHNDFPSEFQLQMDNNPARMTAAFPSVRRAT